MKKSFAHLGIVTWLALSSQAGASGLPDSIYACRCRAVLQQMDSTSLMVVAAANTKARSNDVNYPFRQDNHFLYLTGWERSHGLLLLSPKGLILAGTKVHTIGFRSPSETGQPAETEKGAPAAKGCDTLLSMNRFDAIFNQAMNGISTLYYTLPQPAFVQEPISGKNYFLERDLRKELIRRYPGLRIKPANDLLSRMRQIKSAAEIRLLQKAADITAAGLREAIKSAEPGMYEYELQAIIEYTYQRFGAASPGFPSIIGSGPNSLSPHYDENSRQMQAGDVVVMDVGGEYGGYSADITRTIPVSGKFSPAQRELYEIVLTVQKETLAMMKPGTPRRAVEEKARQVTARELQRLGLIKSAEEVRRFLPHGVSHDIGLDVHDVNQSEVLEVSSVVTLEPGLYVPAGDPAIPQKYWNIGIRIEDDVLIVEQGNQVISSGVVKEIQDIEKLMKEKGLANVRIKL